jgi:hypothetical protein
VEDVQHDRTRTKVKRDVVTDFGARFAGNFDLLQSAPLNGRHANDLALKAPNQSLPIRPDATLSDDPGKVFDVGDVVDFGIDRDFVHAGLADFQSTPANQQSQSARILNSIARPDLQEVAAILFSGFVPRSGILSGATGSEKRLQEMLSTLDFGG